MQCESRYKTILRRKSNCVTHNRKSGEIREEVEYETEINKIKSIDDSVEPEIMMDIKKTVTKEVVPKDKKEDKGVKRKNPEDDFVTVLTKIHDEKEKNKERRHREKMELIKQLMKGNEK